MLYALHIVGLGAWSTPGDAMGMSIVQLHRDRRGLPGRRRAPDGIVLPARRPATGSRSSTWRCSPGALALLGQTWAQAHLPPTRTRDHHEHGAGVRGVLRGAARRRVGRPPGCCSAALLVLAAMLVVELVAAPQDRGRGPAHRGLTGTAARHASRLASRCVGTGPRSESARRHAREPRRRDAMVVVMAPGRHRRGHRRTSSSGSRRRRRGVRQPGVVRTIIGLVGDIESFHHLNLRSTARRRRRAPDLRPLQAGQPPAPPRALHGLGRPPGAPGADRPGHVHVHRRAVRGRDARSRRSRPPQMAKAAGATLLRGGAFKPRTSPYAFQGLGVDGPARSSPTCARRPACRSSPRSSTPATSTVVAEHADMLQVGTRNMANFGLLQAVGECRQAGAAQARHDRHHRGVADGRGVHRPARQPRRRAVRARHPHLRAGHPQHPRHLRRAGGAGDQPPAGHRRPVARRRPQGPRRAAVPGRHRGRRRRRHRRRAPATPRPRSATGRRRCVGSRPARARARPCGGSPRRSAGCRPRACVGRPEPSERLPLPRRARHTLARADREEAS